MPDSPDWPTQIELQITNVSDKVINHIKIEFFVPFDNPRKDEHGVEIDGVTSYIVWFGADTRVPGIAPNARLLPGETIAAKFKDEEYQILNKLMKRYGISSIKEARLIIQGVNFEDGTWFYFGKIYPLSSPAN